MATELIMPSAPSDQHVRHFAPAQRPPHIRSQSYQVAPAQQQLSPLSTSDHDSSNSGRSPLHNVSVPTSPIARHSRPYMPAVLRPNSEFTAQKLSRARTTPHDEASFALRRLSGSGFMGLPGLNVFGQRVSARGDDTKGLDGDWDLQLFPQVTDVPSKKHWKPDAQSTVCDDPTCKRTFNYFIRRHHCRRCGNIFCDSHSSFGVPLDQDANFNPRAPASRTCNHCFQQFKVWHSRNNSRTSSSASSDVINVPPATPITTIPEGNLDLSKTPDVAASVPHNWSWSTF